MTPPPVPLRRVRCAAVGVVTGALAVFAHTGADGRLPDAGLVFSLVALLTWATTGFARHELTPARLLALVGGGQLAMHFVLSLAESRHEHADPSRMVVSHVVATALTIAVLAVAERTVLTVARAVAAVLPRRPAVLPASAPLVVATPAHGPAATVSPDVLSWRGPPAEQV
ncbi:hypothetical protein [Lentzea sp. NPDC059081]|uniref:hypothetical protein n=1 Tax=Lentzea sp. NPDC059081 TaxID=3346719 RepID=UPI0036AE79CE